MLNRISSFVLPLGLLLLMAVALGKLERDMSDIHRSTGWVGTTPVTHYVRTDTHPEHPGGPSDSQRPMVIVAHGFAGSQRLMEPLALHLAGRGYRVITYDQIGHGRHPEPMRGALGTQDGAARLLVDQSHEIVAYARNLTGGDGDVALLGHSMATNILAQTAQEDPEIRALVAISMFAPTVDADTPRNLLVIGGAFEGRLLAEGRRVVGLTAHLPPESVEAGVTYRDPSGSNPRRLAIAPGVEHVGVLYSATTLDEAAAWMDQIFGLSTTDSRPKRAHGRGVWIVLLLVAVWLLARTFVRWLPRVRDRDQAPQVSEGSYARWIALRSGLPAVATPLLLAPAPAQFLPVVVADYVAIHFGVYGILSLLILWITSGRPSLRQGIRGTSITRTQILRMLMATAGLIGFFLLFVALPLDRFFTAFLPGGTRWVLVLLLLAGTIPFFVSDEWITRRQGAPWWTYAATKVIFLCSLGLAVALDFQGLFFLLIIVPLVVLFFLIHGFLSAWTVRRTGSPLVAGLGSAFAFAWALGVTFPFYAGP